MFFAFIRRRGSSSAFVFRVPIAREVRFGDVRNWFRLWPLLANRIDSPQYFKWYFLADRTGCDSTISLATNDGDNRTQKCGFFSVINGARISKVHHINRIRQQKKERQIRRRMQTSTENVPCVCRGSRQIKSLLPILFALRCLHENVNIATTATSKYTRETRTTNVQLIGSEAIKYLPFLPIHNGDARTPTPTTFPLHSFNDSDTIAPHAIRMHSEPRPANEAVKTETK